MASVASCQIYAIGKIIHPITFVKIPSKKYRPDTGWLSSVLKEEACPFCKKIRPCDQAFGIDVYKTVRKLWLPIEVPQKEDDIQNRYGFVLID